MADTAWALVSCRREASVLTCVNATISSIVHRMTEEGIAGGILDDRYGVMAGGLQFGYRHAVDACSQAGWGLLLP
ncbi:MULTISPECIES: hypothetical protein [unclassified Frankia]|uniref:hypothetical protein n=1 Tax=unclassified Frankia TaxID=2632575 RepID=UPI002025AB86